MAGRYLATELQDDNGDVIYPHTEADIVFTSDGTTVEENLSGDFTDAEIQEIFSDNDSQLEAGKKLSVKEKIKRALKKYQALLRMRILDTVEEVEANTDDGYLMGAKAGAALINDLMFPDGTRFYPDKQNGKYGFNTSPTRGADTFSPFKGTVLYLGTVDWTHYLSKTNTYNFSQVIRDAGLDPNDYTADDIFFRPKSTSYKSYTNSNATLTREYTYSNGVITTTAGYVGDMWVLNVTDLCYLVV